MISVRRESGSGRGYESRVQRSGLVASSTTALKFAVAQRQVTGVNPVGDRRCSLADLGALCEDWI